MGVFKARLKKKKKSVLTYSQSSKGSFNKKTIFGQTVTKEPAVAQKSADLTFNLGSGTKKLHDLSQSPSRAQFFFFFFIFH